jgi:hypothetical protein
MQREENDVTVTGGDLTCRDRTVEDRMNLPVGAQGHDLTDDQILNVESVMPARNDTFVNDTVSQATTAGRYEKTQAHINYLTIDELNGDVHSDEKLDNAGERQEGEDMRRSAYSSAGYDSSTLPAEVVAAFESHPEVRDAYYRGLTYHAIFADVKNAERLSEIADRYGGTGKLLEELKGVDQLRAIDRMWYSRDPGQHLEILDNLAKDDPSAFRVMLETLPRVAKHVAPEAWHRIVQQSARQGAEAEAGQRVDANVSSVKDDNIEKDGHPVEGSHAAQLRTALWLSDTNEAVITRVLDAVNMTVSHVLPDHVSEDARRMITGEIYRQVDNSLRSTPELSDLVTTLVSSGLGDPRIQMQIVSLVSQQAKRLIPDVTRRVVSAFGGTARAGRHVKEDRQDKAARRVDVIGSAPVNARWMRSPTAEELKARGIYHKLSDDQILDGAM